MKTENRSSLGIDELGDLAGLLNATDPDVAVVSGPMHLSLEIIDEDPNQPRREDNPGFSAQSLQELADTIIARGVKTPISVRENNEEPGRYIVNHGARRLRASKIAGNDTIPAWVDNDYIEADQVIENLQRNELTPREIADFIGRELAKGTKKGEIAKAIGKSNAYVSQHVTLLDLPDTVAIVFNTGRSTDVTVINEIVKLHRKYTAEVDAWLADDTQDITRSSIKLLKEFLASKHQPGEIEESSYMDDTTQEASNHIEDNSDQDDTTQETSNLTEESNDQDNTTQENSSQAEESNDQDDTTQETSSLTEESNDPKKAKKISSALLRHAADVRNIAAETNASELLLDEMADQIEEIAKRLASI